ncbi:MAG: TetR/AcrR family transcriptional regulator [Bacteroidia bacterium]
MELEVRIKINSKLYLRNPEESVLGKKIVKNGLVLINEIGFEDFTFKKLAASIDTTEAGIYRYFENKHRFLVYLINWYWSYCEYKVVFQTNNIKDAETKLKTIIRILVEQPQEHSSTSYMCERELYKLIMWEGSKSYLTKKVNKDNSDRIFKPYKDLCARIAQTIKEYNPKYKFPHSLSSSLIEMSHSQNFFMQNLPSLTDFKEKDEKQLIQFLESLLFNTIDKKGK